MGELVEVAADVGAIIGVAEGDCAVGYGVRGGGMRLAAIVLTSDRPTPGGVGDEAETVHPASHRSRLIMNDFAMYKNSQRFIFAISCYQ